MDKEGIISRIKQIMNEFGYNQAMISAKVGIHPSNISAILNGKRPCDEAVINKFVIALNVNKDWLLSGEGEMLNNNLGSDSKLNEANYTLVPLINIDSVGGMNHGNLITSGEQYAERLIPFTEARDGDVAIYQSGDSMNPGIPSGSILLIRNVPDWREYFGYGDVFVLWLKDDRRLTKQVKKFSPDPANYVTCHSFNPDFGDEELPKKYIREVWKVIKVLADKGW